MYLLNTRIYIYIYDTYRIYITRFIMYIYIYILNILNIYTLTCPKKKKTDRLWSGSKNSLTCPEETHHYIGSSLPN